MADSEATRNSCSIGHVGVTGGAQVGCPQEHCISDMWNQTPGGLQVAEMRACLCDRVNVCLCEALCSIPGVSYTMTKFEAAVLSVGKRKIKERQPSEA